MKERSNRKIIHFTTVHSRDDVRISFKEIASVVDEAIAEVTLLVADGKGNEIRDGVSVRDVGSPPFGRVSRMSIGSWLMWRLAKKQDAEIAQFHDPELIPVGLALKLSGVKVIYDVHEDLPRQILGKYWLSPWLRRPVSWFAEVIDWVAGRSFDGVVAATPTIAGRFPVRKTVTVQNFPLLSELGARATVRYTERPPHFAYVGGLGSIRGSREIVEAIGRMSDEFIRLQFAGKFSNARDEEAARSLEGWAQVDYHGWASRPEVAQVLGNVRAGLVLFHPSPAHRDAQPNKMFEYMAAGLPVIASDFPLWREIVDGAGCGLLVDPLDPEAIAAAMQWLLENPEEAEVMGRRGREAVEETYNWEPEAEKLIALYRQLIPCW